MNQLQQESLEILKAVSKIFEENEIPYLLYAGTLLGAVRHEGFIPWDDDLDIMIPRSYYQKSINLLETQLPCNLVLQSRESDKYYANAFYKIRNKNTLIVEKVPKTQKGYVGAWLDVFPFDYVPEDLKKRKQHFKKVNKYNKLIRIFLMTEGQGTNTFADILKKNIQTINEKFYTKYFWLSFLFIRRDSLIEKYNTNSSDSNILGDLTYMYYENFEEFEKSIMNSDIFNAKNITYAKFEGLKLPIPNEYDKYLRNLYGDYMILPKNEERTGHNLEKIK